MKYLISAFLVIVLSISLCSCFDIGQDQEGEDLQRFFVVDVVVLDIDRNVRVLVDRDTKVMYCYVQGYRSGGLCVLVDENGLPMLYDDSSLGS